MDDQIKETPSTLTTYISSPEIINDNELRAARTMSRHISPGNKIYEQTIGAIALIRSKKTAPLT